ncbi:DUF1003 domain-containing protein [bacterium]|nr:DUF1003 domain-containing protein [bacterium]
MKKNSDIRQICAICGKAFAAADIVAGAVVRDPVAELIRKEHPGWAENDFICQSDLSDFRSKYVHSLLESEKGELSDLEHEVLDRLQEQELLAKNVEEEYEQDWTLGERLADRIASFGGSWKFLILFGIVLTLWIAINSAVLLLKPVDPYPFILLNLLLSCLAAIQAPIIMMSQNRQESKDRIRSQHDYQVNLKAELEIRQLHEKLDHLLQQQWQRLAQIQEIQMEQLAELGRIKR